jgi:hypothetical protein
MTTTQYEYDDGRDAGMKWGQSAPLTEVAGFASQASATAEGLVISVRPKTWPNLWATLVSLVNAAYAEDVPFELDTSAPWERGFMDGAVAAHRDRL